ncbi:MAG: pectinesterase [Chloroflexi bacterium]|nr:pectinesterase [Chloroflexota bacterium]
MMDRHWLLVIVIVMGFCLLVLPSTSTTTAQGCPDGQMRVNGVCGDASLISLTSGWNKIEPGGETACAHDTPYAYWVRPGLSNDLLVYFQGGGGCWDADTCRDTGEEFNGFYDSAITDQDDPKWSQGMLDFDHPENPFAGYTVVYIPVCTGDIHWGDNIHTYEDAEEGDVTIHFKGYVNAAAALDWAYTNIAAPDSVFVTGCSAGSAGSIYHTPYIIEHYPNTPVYQLGDSLSLLFTGAVDLQTDWHSHDHFPSWIPALADMQPNEWTMAKHYIAVANHYPMYTFAQFNSIRDRVQVFYTYPNGGGDAEDWSALLDTHLAEIEANAPNYRAFTPGGTLHCVTPRDAFYDYAINGIRFRDWVADLASGKPVESLHCDDCTTAELQ